MNISIPNDPQFNKYYTKHCKYLKLKGLQPKTIEAYARAIRRIGNYFDGQLNNLSQDQLLDYFHDLLDSHSWSAVKLDLYGLKFFYTNVLQKTWKDIPLIKPPKTTRIPDIVTIEQADQLFAATGKLSYKGISSINRGNWSTCDELSGLRICISDACGTDFSVMLKQREID